MGLFIIVAPIMILAAAFLSPIVVKAIIGYIGYRIISKPKIEPVKQKSEREQFFETVQHAVANVFGPDAKWRWTESGDAYEAYIANERPQLIITDEFGATRAYVKKSEGRPVICFLSFTNKVMPATGTDVDYIETETATVNEAAPVTVVEEEPSLTDAQLHQMAAAKVEDIMSEISGYIYTAHSEGEDSVVIPLEILPENPDIVSAMADVLANDYGMITEVVENGILLNLRTEVSANG